MKVQIEIGWEEVLREEFDKEYFIKITAFLKLEKSKGKIIFPTCTQFHQGFEGKGQSKMTSPQLVKARFQ